MGSGILPGANLPARCPMMLAALVPTPNLVTSLGDAGFLQWNVFRGQRNDLATKNRPTVSRGGSNC